MKPTVCMGCLCTPDMPIEPCPFCAQPRHKLGTVIQTIEIALKSDHDGAPAVSGSILRSAVTFLKSKVRG
jgi:hypothetical protein